MPNVSAPPPLGRSRLAAIVMSSLVAASSRGQTPGPSPDYFLTTTKSIAEGLPSLSETAAIAAFVSQRGDDVALSSQFFTSPAVRLDLTSDCPEEVLMRVSPRALPGIDLPDEFRPSISGDGSRVASARDIDQYRQGDAAVFYKYDMYVWPNPDPLGPSFYQQANGLNGDFFGRFPSPQLSGDGRTLWFPIDLSDTGPTFPWLPDHGSRMYELSGTPVPTLSASCDIEFFQPGTTERAVSRDGRFIAGGLLDVQSGIRGIERWTRPAASGSWCSGAPTTLRLANVDIDNRYIVDVTISDDGKRAAWTANDDHCLAVGSSFPETEVWVWSEDGPLSWAAETCPSPGGVGFLSRVPLPSGTNFRDSHAALDGAGRLLSFLSIGDYALLNPNNHDAIFVVDLDAPARNVMQVSETIPPPDTSVDPPEVLRTILGPAISANGEAVAYMITGPQHAPSAISSTEVRFVNLALQSAPAIPDSSPVLPEEPFDIDVLSCSPTAGGAEATVNLRQRASGSKKVYVVVEVTDGAARVASTPIVQPLGDGEFAELRVPVAMSPPPVSPTCTARAWDLARPRADMSMEVLP